MVTFFTPSRKETREIKNANSAIMSEDAPVSVKQINLMQRSATFKTK